MKSSIIIPVSLLLCATGCRKDAPVTRQHCHIVGVQNALGQFSIEYNPDGTIRNDGYGVFTHFNDGTLSERLEATDTATLDKHRRLQSLRIPFADDKRQLRTYEYNARNQVVRTHTFTGNGLDYLVDLIWENGDVAQVDFQVATHPPAERPYMYSYYDIPTTEPYLALRTHSQLGTIYNAHLLKQSIFWGDTSHYSYRFDSANRVIAMYRDYNNRSAARPRAIDTTHFQYGCDE